MVIDTGGCFAGGVSARLIYVTWRYGVQPANPHMSVDAYVRTAELELKDNKRRNSMVLD